MINKIKNLINYIKNRLLAPKYIRKGNCKQCGKCCSSIILADNGVNISSIEEFKTLKLKYKKYHHFEPVGKDEQGNFLFKCKSLSENNKCKDYFFRSLYCRKYPDIDKKFIMAGGKMLDGCGYNIEPSKKFSEFLN